VHSKQSSHIYRCHWPFLACLSFGDVYNATRRAAPCDAFLREHGFSVMVWICAQGAPSGEAFIQMDSEYAAELASTTKTRKLYVINGAKRYVEVIQCCGDDMNVALNSGLSPPSPASAAGALQPAVPSQPLNVVSCIPSSSLVLPGQAHIIASPVQPRSYLSPGSSTNTIRYQMFV